jgi:Ca2+-binding EF-hand superfamily protein
MSKPKINTDEMLKDIQKAFDLIDKIDNGNIDLNKIPLKTKELKETFKKYSKDLDLEK